jgi:hypothetical protein
MAETCKSLDQLVQEATAILYNRDLAKERTKDKCQEVLIVAMWVTPLQAGSNPQACFLYGQEGHFSWQSP